MKELKIQIILFALISAYFGWSLNSCFNAKLQKYRPLEKVLEQTKSHPYDAQAYNCLDFSKAAQSLLTVQGIESSIITGNNGSSTNHAYLGIWMDPQTGEFITGYQFRGVYGQ